MTAVVVALAHSPNANANPDDITAAVRFFYVNRGFELGTLSRHRFSEKLRNLLDASDRAPDGVICFPYALSSGGPRSTDDLQSDDDIVRFEDDLARTITYKATMSDADHGTVRVNFVALDETMNVDWSVTGDETAWFIDDISSPDNGWRFSEQSCPY